jgi:hypothetical protein
MSDPHPRDDDRPPRDRSEQSETEAEHRGHHGADCGHEADEPGASWRRRKERILHTRVSQQLSEEIRRVAEDLRVPVSNLVRNVLEEAFHVVEQVSGDVGGIVEEVLEEAERARERFRRRAWRHRDHWHERDDERREATAAERRDAPAAERSEAPSAPERDPQRAFPGVVGWQPLVLDVERRCACDGRPLARGEDAWAGLTEQGLSGVYLCGACMTARRSS